MRTLDYSPLTNPVTPTDIRVLRSELRQAGISWDRHAGDRADFPLLVGGGLLIVPLVPLLLVILSARSSVEITGILVGLSVLSPAFVLYLALVGTVVAVLHRRGSNSWERLVRLARFAWANDMVYFPAAAARAYPGAIFTTGRSHATTDLLEARSGAIHIGRHSYVTGMGKYTSTHYWDFMAIRLNRRLPHMVLDSRENNTNFGQSNLPRPLASTQRLSLEGDFDQYFTLYCPREYERDALYIFTPDLMALLIDNVAPFDVEIVDDWMYVYSDTDLDLVDPVVQMRFASIADTVGGKTLSQSRRYADHRVVVAEAKGFSEAPNYIAPLGRRLRAGFPIASVAVVLAGLAFTIWLITLFAISNSL